MAQPYFRAKQSPAVLVFSLKGKLRLVVAGRRLGIMAVQRLPARAAGAIPGFAPNSGGRSR